MLSRSAFTLILHGVCSTIIAQTLTMSNPIFWCKYDCRLQVPTEVRWSVSRINLGSSQREPSWKFKSDVPAPWGVARHETYIGSGYDRGHMAPAADFSISKTLMRQTFVMSNICPQTPALNRGPWKRTEIAERMIAQMHDSCHVLALPLFLKPDTVWIGGKLVAVPDAFVKLIYNTNPDTLYQIYFLWNR